MEGGSEGSSIGSNWDHDCRINYSAVLRGQSGRPGAYRICLHAFRDRDVSGHSRRLQETSMDALRIGNLPLILDVAVGFRFNLVLVTIGCVLLWLAEKGPVQLSSRLHVYCTIALTVLVLGVSANPIRLNGVKVAFEYLSVPNNLYDEFFRLEPFVTQAIANESFRNELSCLQYDWRQFALLVVPLPRLLNFRPELFEVQYKPLFPDVKFGLAGNPWAEAFCRNGWIGFFLLLAFF